MKAKDLSRHIVNYALYINKPISPLVLYCCIFLTNEFYKRRFSSSIVDEGFYLEPVITAKGGVPIIHEVYEKYSFWAANPINIYEEPTETFQTNEGGLIYGFIDKLITKYYPSELLELAMKYFNAYK